MAKNREQQVNLYKTEYYHIISRCVRRTFLCGCYEIFKKILHENKIDKENDYSNIEVNNQDSSPMLNYNHRREWLEDWLIKLAEAFAIEILEYSFMSNHFHIVIHVNKELAENLSDEEVILRWLSVYKGDASEEEFLNSTKTEREELLTKPIFKNRAEKYRERLYSVSWFMKTLKEHIAKKANKEENVTGHFWEGRFKSIPINVDNGYERLMETMVYVALNPIRAAITDDPEYAHYTGLYQRLSAEKVEKLLRKNKITEEEAQKMRRKREILAQFEDEKKIKLQSYNQSYNGAMHYDETDT